MRYTQTLMFFGLIFMAGVIPSKSANAGMCGEQHKLRVYTEGGYQVGVLSYYDNDVCDEVLTLSSDKPSEFFRKLREHVEK